MTIREAAGAPPSLVKLYRTRQYPLLKQIRYSARVWGIPYGHLIALVKRQALTLSDVHLLEGLAKRYRHVQHWSIADSLEWLEGQK